MFSHLSALFVKTTRTFETLCLKGIKTLVTHALKNVTCHGAVLVSWGRVPALVSWRCGAALELLGPSTTSESWGHGTALLSESRHDIGVMGAQRGVVVVRARRGIVFMELWRGVGVVRAWHCVGVVGARRSVVVVGARRDVGVVRALHRVSVVGARRPVVGVMASWHAIGTVGVWHHVGVVRAQCGVGVMVSWRPLQVS
ncbi:hypothetical protein EDB85DRAFT_1891006 [Lactarius pseudohatsudake]|nr:hypothetical protein EDB85DRAFT_1891006 [Lactarius pseudohatsudake]